MTIKCNHPEVKYSLQLLGWEHEAVFDYPTHSNKIL